ncbi:hypothetical protein KV557_31350 [Kitasatospora aureofaciens]|uniref:hypothetical protein n=1 Tax=Kitasatospora aureofaciens TaxID=1894 RepID=UPI001C48021B|nr:hypothetical protein [Kitasatospora aureofaciens]MBV6701558.1 hypothetical protein [Kitasatospora aureofaciens]
MITWSTICAEPLGRLSLLRPDNWNTVPRRASDGPETDIRLGDEGLAVRMVTLDEVPALKVPPYMQHYLPLLTGAANQPPRRTT